MAVFLVLVGFVLFVELGLPLAVEFEDDFGTVDPLSFEVSFELLSLLNDLISFLSALGFLPLRFRLLWLRLIAHFHFLVFV